MDQTNTPRRPGGQRRLLFAGLIGLLLFIALALWGGAPPPEKLAAFIAGLSGLIVVVFGIGLAGWHLLLRPLPPGHKRPALAMQPAGQRRLMAALVTISGINLIVGGFWDEVWHRQYGIPFGEDLFWRPHLLIYSSILLICVLTAWAWFTLIRKGRGSWQQRFRANPILGLLALVGVFLFLALPADPAWHLLYGDDIAAWSIPHIVLTFSFALVLLLAAAIQMSTVRPRSWPGSGRFQAADVPVIVAYAFILTVGLQALTTDWDGGSVALLMTRPAWLLPAVIAGLATGAGALANHTLRRAGAATLTGGLALAIRFLLIEAFDYQEIGVGAWLASLGPMLAIDLWYGWRVFRMGRPANWLTTGLIAATGAALIAFPVINAYYAYPAIELANLPAMLLAVVAAAGGAAWVGQSVGDYLAVENKQLEEGLPARSRLQLVPPLAFLAIIGFIAFFVSTAGAPV